MIKQVVANFSFETQKANYRNNAESGSNWLRAGKLRQWQSVYDSDSLQVFNKYNYELLELLGYETRSQWFGSDRLAILHVLWDVRPSGTLNRITSIAEELGDTDFYVLDWRSPANQQDAETREGPLRYLATEIGKPSRASLASVVILNVRLFLYLSKCRIFNLIHLNGSPFCYLLALASDLCKSSDSFSH